MTTPTFAAENITPNGIRYWKIDSDAYGNPRYVVHYLSVSSTSDEGKGDYVERQGRRFESARERVYGNRYRAKWFGGGIVFQSYLGDRGIGTWLDQIAESNGGDN